ncbi:MAG: hypothetical protein U0T83_00490 [Bacteriovoracaceae bacterium]
MKVLLKKCKVSLFVLLITSLIFGCTKTNKTANNLQSQIPISLPSGPIPGVSNPVSGNAVVDAEVAKLYAQVPCKTVAERYTYEFSTVNSYHSGIMGPFGTGSSPGIVSDAYVGLSYFGDIMIVKKVTNGAQVAYNITFSMCRYDPIIVPGRPIPQMFDTQIVLHKGSCPLNEVSSAKVVMVAGSLPQANGSNLMETQFSTTFAPPDILGIKICNSTSF